MNTWAIKKLDGRVFTAGEHRKPGTTRTVRAQQKRERERCERQRKKKRRIEEDRGERQREPERTTDNDKDARGQVGCPVKH